MSEAAAAPGKPALSVLLLEDSRFDAELLREALLAAYPAARLDVVRTEAGFDQALAQGGYDLVLSDYELPGFSGLQALEKALFAAPDVPFVFVSGVIGEDNAVEMLKRGATDYVSKSRMARLPVVIARVLREVQERQARGRAERQLREADAIYARVVDSLSGYAVVLLDEHGCVRHGNRATQQVFGYSAHELLGASADTLFVEEDRQAGIFQAQMQAAHAGEHPVEERWMQRKNGQRLRAEAVLSPLHSDGGVLTGFSLIVRDTTAAWLQAEALRQAKDEAESANLAKDRFIAVLSHELRTPLTPIAQATHVLEQFAQVPMEHQALLPMIRRNVALEARLIDDLLDVTAISSGKLSLRLAPVDMHELLRTIVQMMQHQIDERALQLVVDLQAHEPWVMGDEARLQQVMWNLMRNALKFTAPGGRITLHTQSQAGGFRLQCADTGIGIEAEALPRIFSAFEQADGTVSRHYGGLGLGLAIAHGLVSQHQGSLTAHSNGRGQGAVFTVELPSYQTQSVPLDASEEASHASATAACKVLLVEDNLDAAETLAMCLELYGYAVRHAQTCSQALQMAQEDTYDIVLTDLGLPDASGVEIGRKLGGLLPVVALSGYGTEQDVKSTSAAGFSGHLVKPTNPDTVHAMIQKLLTKGAPPRAATPDTNSRTEN